MIRAVLAAAGLAATLVLAPQPHFLAQVQKPADIHLVDLRSIEFTGPEIPIRGSAAIVDLAANRLIFPQREVYLWVQFEPHGVRPGSFMINGLRDPEIELRVGTRLTVTLLIWSLSRTANFEIVSRGPPFDPFPAPDHYRFNYYLHVPGTFPPMHHPSPRVWGSGYTVYGARLVYDIRSAGRAWYVSNTQNGANAGEYGRILVVP